MEASTPLQSPPDRIDGDPGAGWRRFARFGAVSFFLSILVTWPYFHDWATWIHWSGYTRSYLGLALSLSLLAVGPVYTFLCSPRMLQRGVVRSVGLTLLTALWICGIGPLAFLFFDDSSNPVNGISCALFTSYLFVLFMTLLWTRRLSLSNRLLVLGTVPLLEAIAASVLFSKDLHSVMDLGPSPAELTASIAAVASSSAVLIFWGFWQRVACVASDNK